MHPYRHGHHMTYLYITVVCLILSHWTGMTFSPQGISSVLYLAAVTSASADLFHIQIKFSKVLKCKEILYMFKAFAEDDAH